MNAHTPMPKQEAIIIASEMWKRGDKTRDIAAAVGLSTGQVITKWAKRNRELFPYRGANERYHVARIMFGNDEIVLDASEYDTSRVHHAKSLLDIGACECRWPVMDGPMLFCAAEVVHGKPYCQNHYERSIGEGTISERNAVDDAKRMV